MLLIIEVLHETVIFNETEATAAFALTRGSINPTAFVPDRTLLNQCVQSDRDVGGAKSETTER